MGSLVESAVDSVKKKVYGKTFFCPVCHVELSKHDVDENGLLVCPLCGVVIELANACGHEVPVVHGVEIRRHQPKTRTHPISTHIPIGLFPFALLGSLVLLFNSFFYWIMPYFDLNPILGNSAEYLLRFSPTLSRITLFLLTVSVLFSCLTYLSGVLDWKSRYESRRYRCVTLKIWFSSLFIVMGIFSILLLYEGCVFSSMDGLIHLDATSLFCAGVYFIFMFVNMIVLATLGHVGGLLVLGR